MKKKLLSIMLASVVATSTLLTGCGSSDSSSGSTGTTGSGSGSSSSSSSDVVEIDWYVHESWFSSQAGNLALDIIEEETGVRINFTAPVGDPNEKLNPLIAANKLPDVVTMGWWNGQVNEISIPEYTYSYNELIEMVPELADNLDESVFNWYKADDGNTYAYPCNSVSEADVDAGLTSNRTFLVRQDIYEAIGSPDMRTPEGFLQALSDAKEMFPEALNGDPLIPFGTTEFTSTGNTGLEDMLLEFLAVPREYNGQYEEVLNGHPSDEYMTWLKTFRQAHEDGLMPVDLFIDDRTKIEEKIQQGRYFCMLYQAQDAMSPIGQLYKNNPESCYIAVDGPSNSDLDQHQLAVPGYAGWEVTFVTKNAENPEAIARLLAWGHSQEGQEALYYGKEGVTYDLVDGKKVIKPEITTMKNEDNGTFKKMYNTYNEYWMFANTANLLAWEEVPEAPFDQYKEWSQGKSAFYGIYDNVAPPSDSDEAEIGTKVNIKWGETLPKLIQASSDAEFDQIWSDFQAYKDSAGYDQYMAYIRAGIEENKTKFD